MSATLALMQRSLSVAARTWRTYWSRMVLVGMVMFWLLTAREGWSSTAPGQRLFVPVVWSNVFFLTMAGMYLFAAAIAEEKEFQTLPLLRMSSLSSLAILLGKSASQLLAVGLLVVCQLPFTLLAMTLGGVSPDQIYATYANLLGYVAILGGIGVFASVAQPTAARAMGLATSLLALLFLGPLLAYGIVYQLALMRIVTPDGWIDAGVRELGAFLLEQSPYTQLGRSASVGFAGPVFGVHLLYQLAFAAALFLASWLAFDRWNRHEAPRAARSWWRPGGAKNRTSGAVWSGMPYAWKDYRFLAGGTPWLVLKFFLYGAVIALVAFAADADRLSELRATILWLSIPMLVLELAIVASRVFSSEVTDKTIPVLVMLPTSVSVWAYGKLAGALCAAIPAAMWVAIGLLPELDDFLRTVNRASEWLALSTFVMAFVTYLHVVAWLSLYTRGAVVFGMVVMWLAGMGMTIPRVFLRFGGGGSGVMELMLTVYTGTMVAFCVASHLFIGRKLVSLASAG